MERFCVPEPSLSSLTSGGKCDIFEPFFRLFSDILNATVVNRLGLGDDESNR